MPELPEVETIARGVDARVRGDRIALLDRKSTRLNSSHQIISYAVFCLKKKLMSSVARRLQVKCKVMSSFMAFNAGEAHVLNPVCPNNDRIALLAFAAGINTSVNDVTR